MVILFIFTIVRCTPKGAIATSIDEEKFLFERSHLFDRNFYFHIYYFLSIKVYILSQ
jgi:hypothetical protein